MIVMVDEANEQENIEGFKFTNKDGNVEGVVLHDSPTCSYFSLVTLSGQTEYYFEDIPKLIKALEAAHRHHKLSAE